MLQTMVEASSPQRPIQLARQLAGAPDLGWPLPAMTSPDQRSLVATDGVSPSTAFSTLDRISSPRQDRTAADRT